MHPGKGKHHGKGKGEPPPMPRSPPRNMALLRDYHNPLVSLNKAWPYYSLISCGGTLRFPWIFIPVDGNQKSGKFTPWGWLNPAPSPGGRPWDFWLPSNSMTIQMWMCFMGFLIFYACKYHGNFDHSEIQNTSYQNGDIFVMFLSP